MEKLLLKLKKKRKERLPWMTTATENSERTKVILKWAKKESFSKMRWCITAPNNSQHLFTSRENILNKELISALRFTGIRMCRWTIQEKRKCRSSIQMTSPLSKQLLKESETMEALVEWKKRSSHKCLSRSLLKFLQKW